MDKKLLNSQNGYDRYSYQTSYGQMYIESDGQGITSLYFSNQTEEVTQEIKLIRQAYCQVEEYLSGKRFQFELPLSMRGTAFQKSVWDALMKIPYGRTLTYQDIALSLGNPNSSRAVGGACNKNPIAIIVPCHRVVGKSGSLTGYAYGIDMKHKLLELEKQNK